MEMNDHSWVVYCDPYIIQSGEAGPIGTKMRYGTGRKTWHEVYGESIR